MNDAPGLPENARVALFRLSALGDVCNCVALIRCLQRARPDVRLHWIIGRGEHRLVEDLPGVSFIPVDKRAGVRAWPGLRREMHAGGPFDALLCAQVSARANLLSLAVPARRRIGFDRARAREGHGLVVGERIAAREFQHQAEAFLEFARLLGIDPEPATIPDRAPPIPEEAREFARKHLPQDRLAVLISPCSSHPLRDWSVTGYAAVADWVMGETGRPVVLLGGPSARERETGAAIEAATRAGRPVNLIGRDTLKQALALLERGACLVSPDSGPAHFAAALGTPVVGLYAATWSRRSGPLGSLQWCVDRFPDAARRFRGKPPEALRWGSRIEEPGVMDLIDPPSVIARLAALLEDQQATS